MTRAKMARVATTGALLGTFAMVGCSSSGGGAQPQPSPPATGGGGVGGGGTTGGDQTGGATGTNGSGGSGSGGSGSGGSGSGGSGSGGSGVADAGMPADTGGSDKGANEGGAPAPCQSLFCESFENVPAGSPPDPAIWTRTIDTLVVDVTDGALGSKKALHVPAIVNGFDYIREKKSIAAMGTKFYGRAWFRIDKRPIEKPNGLFHWTLLSADELDDYMIGKLLRFGGHVEAANTIWLRFNFQTHGNPGETGIDDMNYTLDLKKWYCVEFYYSLPDQEARFWMNGVEDPLLHWQKSVPGYTFPPSISQMSFGWAVSHGLVTPWEVWVDEIALDTKKIGCGN